MIALTKDTKLTLLYITIAFSFSVLMRLIWVYHFNGYEAFMFNGQFMINTNDGYFFAEGARDILSGSHQPNDLSAVDYAASQLTAFFVRVLPFSFESVILYMPIFLSSLVVIPIILISRSLKNLEMGLIASLLASIAWSYYNRTMVGYYDTDMLNIVIPMFLLWSIILAIRTNEDKYLLIMALDILVYRWWYPASYSLEVSFLGMILLYTLLFDRKNLYNYKMMSMMLLAMVMLDGYSRTVLIFIAFFAFKQEKVQEYIYYIFAASVTLFLLTGGFNPVWAKMSTYVFKDALVSSVEGLNLHFFSVKQTIREAGQIPFKTFANRISGDTATFIFAIIGYILLSFRHRVMLFALPMIGLGFLASVGGLRFTIYAVPILALGVGFLITEIGSQLKDKRLKFALILFLTLMVLYPNYKHIQGYKVPTVFNAKEVKILDTLKSIADREDYVVGWWDYGYPIRYYSDVKTLIDGGKHYGNVNFPVSYILSNPQLQAAQMARLDVEYTEMNFDSNRSFSNIEQMTNDYGFKDTNDFLFSLSTNIELPKKTRDVYIYLPFKMLEIYPTVNIFSNMDLMSGKRYKRPFYFVSKRFSEKDGKINLGRGIYFDTEEFALIEGGNNMSIKRLVTTKYDNNRVLNVDIQDIDANAKISVIYMANYKTFILVDEQSYNSLYIQLMVLEKYDKNLFEMVVSNLHAKVYRLKI